jgi:HNH endonuclease
VTRAMDIIDTDDQDWCEFWMVVADHPTYEASSLGRVRDRETLVIKRDHRYARGYRAIYLDGIQWKVHRLVMMTFVANPLNKRTVNHISGNKADNRLSNLEWATHSENNLHAYATGLQRPLPGRAVRQLSLDGVELATYTSMNEAAQAAGIDRGSVRHAANGGGNTVGGFRYEFI